MSILLGFSISYRDCWTDASINAPVVQLRPKCGPNANLAMYRRFYGDVHPIGIEAFKRRTLLNFTSVFKQQFDSALDFVQLWVCPQFRPFLWNVSQERSDWSPDCRRFTTCHKTSRTAIESQVIPTVSLTSFQSE